MALTSGFEVEFILGDHTAIEVKAKKSVSPNDIKSLRMLEEEEKLRRYICISMEPRRRTIGNIDIMQYREFLDLLWDEAYL